MLLTVDTLSDNHDLYPNMPGGHLLLHTGDATMDGEEGPIIRFANYLNSLKYDQIIFTPGNHDFGMESTEFDHLFNKNIKILRNQYFTYQGLNFFGTPFVPMFKHWGFGRTYEQRKTLFSMIPDDTDILLSHGPAYETLDLSFRQERLGCLALKEELEKLPSVFLHVFGHIHESYGVKETPLRTSVNASYGYRGENPPIRLIINTETKQIESIDQLTLEK